MYARPELLQETCSALKHGPQQPAHATVGAVYAPHIHVGVLIYDIIWDMPCFI